MSGVEYSRRVQSSSRLERKLWKFIVSILKLFLESGLGCFFFGDEVSFGEPILRESLENERSPEGVVGVVRLLSWNGKSSKRLELKFFNVLIIYKVHIMRKY